MVHLVKHSAYSQLTGKHFSQQTLSLILPGWGRLLKMLQLSNFITYYRETFFASGTSQPGSSTATSSMPKAKMTICETATGPGGTSRDKPAPAHHQLPREALGAMPTPGSAPCEPWGLLSCCKAVGASCCQHMMCSSSPFNMKQQG